MLKCETFNRGVFCPNLFVCLFVWKGSLFKIRLHHKIALRLGYTHMQGQS